MYIVIETFPEEYIITDEDGNNKEFETREQAEDEVLECNRGKIIEIQYYIRICQLFFVTQHSNQLKLITMRVFLFITGLVMLIQIVGLIVMIVDDGVYGLKGNDRNIKSKRDVWRMFIPYFWVATGIRKTILWWQSLK